MKLKYWLEKFRIAVLESDYDEQSKVAEKLQLFEACGLLQESEIIQHHQQSRNSINLTGRRT